MTALEAHRANRPELPRPVPPVESAAYQTWRKKYAIWVAELERLETKATLAGIEIVFERKAPNCLPKSDYIYREPVKRRRKVA